MARSSAEGSSIIVAIGTSRLRWFMVQKRKKKHSEVRVWLREVSTASSFTKPASFRSLFRRPDVAFCTSLFSFTIDAQLQVGQAAARGRAKRSSHPWHFRCWSPKRNELEFTDLVPLDCGITPFFVTWCNYRCWFCVRKGLWRWFYPRSRKRDRFQTLATGVSNLKTYLGTQRVKVGVYPSRYRSKLNDGSNPKGTEPVLISARLQHTGNL